MDCSGEFVQLPLDREVHLVAFFRLYFLTLPPDFTSVFPLFTTKC